VSSFLVQKREGAVLKPDKHSVAAVRTPHLHSVSTLLIRERTFTIARWWSVPVHGRMLRVARQQQEHRLIDLPDKRVANEEDLSDARGAEKKAGVDSVEEGTLGVYPRPVVRARPWARGTPSVFHPPRACVAAVLFNRKAEDALASRPQQDGFCGEDELDKEQKAKRVQPARGLGKVGHLLNFRK
jgi:hypothetical protein